MTKRYLLIIGLIITGVQMFSRDLHLDMAVYRRGVQAFLDGGSMYAERMLVGDIALPFIYPPFGALFLLPLGGSWISDAVAGNLIVAISNLALLGIVWLVARAFGAQQHTWWLWAMILLFEPVRLNNVLGQINIIIMVLVVLDLVPRKRRLPQGWLIGVAAAIKITPLAMLLYFLLRKDYRAIITAGVSGALATLLAAIVRPDATWEFFSVKLLDMGSGDDIGVNTFYQSNSSIKAMLQRISPDFDANTWWALLAVMTILLGAWLMRAQLRRGLDIDAWLVGSFIMLLISPISWSHHWVWLTLALPVFLYRAWQWRAWPLAVVTGIWTLLVLTVPPKWWVVDAVDVYSLSPLWKFLISDFVWLAVLTLGCYSVALARHKHAK